MKAALGIFPAVLERAPFDPSSKSVCSHLVSVCVCACIRISRLFGQLCVADMLSDSDISGKWGALLGFYECIDTVSRSKEQSLLCMGPGPPAFVLL